MMRVDEAAAWVLHVRPWRDTSLLCELFTAGHGRLGTIVKGARGRRGSRRALLQPFRPLLVGWQGRGELATLTRVESAGEAPRLEGDAVHAGFYLNELLVRLLPRNQPQPPEMFVLYQESLSLLAAGEMEIALRRFEKRLLELLGYGHRFDRLADSGQPVHEARLYRFQPGVGVTACGEEEGGIPGAHFLALAREDWRPEALASHRRILQAALAPLLGDRPLHSRTVYRAMRRLVEAHREVRDRTPAVHATESPE